LLSLFAPHRAFGRPHGCRLLYARPEVVIVRSSRTDLAAARGLCPALLSKRARRPPMVAGENQEGALSRSTPMGLARFAARAGPRRDPTSRPAAADRPERQYCQPR